MMLIRSDAMAHCCRRVRFLSLFRWVRATRRLPVPASRRSRLEHEPSTSGWVRARTDNAGGRTHCQPPPDHAKPENPRNDFHSCARPVQRPSSAERPLGDSEGRRHGRDEHSLVANCGGVPAGGEETRFSVRRRLGAAALMTKEPDLGRMQRAIRRSLGLGSSLQCRTFRPQAPQRAGLGSCGRVSVLWRERKWAG